MHWNSPRVRNSFDHQLYVKPLLGGIPSITRHDRLGYTKTMSKGEFKQVKSSHGILPWNSPKLFTIPKPEHQIRNNSNVSSNNEPNHL